MSKKLPPRPAWQKKTDFWIAAALVLLAIVGLIRGDGVILDPGQKHEGHLYVVYFLGGLAMFVNGWISHRQAIQHYDEALDATGITRGVETHTASPEPEPEVPGVDKVEVETTPEKEN